MPLPLYNSKLYVLQNIEPSGRCACQEMCLSGDETCHGKKNSIHFLQNMLWGGIYLNASLVSLQDTFKQI